MGVEKRCPRLGWRIEGIGGLEWEAGRGLEDRDRGIGVEGGRRAEDWRGGGGGVERSRSNILILLPSKSTKRIENMELHQAKNIKFLVASCEDTQVSYPKDSPKRNMEED